MDQAVARGNPANPAAGRPKQGTRAKRLPVDERRRQLIELGIEIFSENPYEDISTSEIAEQAQISKGLLYHYFPSKRHFFLETIREIGRRLVEATEWDPSLDFARAGYQSLRGYLACVDAC